MLKKNHPMLFCKFGFITLGLFLGMLLSQFACKQNSRKEDTRLAPLFDDLGNLHFPISTSIPAAQKYFNQGLTLVYGFNHQEAVRSFQEAARLDPECAMAYWGQALALGPNINKHMDALAASDALIAVRQAVELSPHATAKEQALIAAQARRFSDDPSVDRNQLNHAYAKAMYEVVRRFPDDPDAATLLAEALMLLNPWSYWSEDGQPKTNTAEMVAMLETVIERSPDHCGANHYYIHAVEASPHFEKALASAERLESLVPGAGHLVHMPSHIYLRVGRYHDATLANQRAAQADESYISQCNAQGFYPTVYYPHNLHFLWASASMEGRFALALEAARKVVAGIPANWFKKYSALEEFRPLPLFTLARFGKWEDILQEPAPDHSALYTTGIWHYARGLALLALQQPEQAKAEQQQLQALADNETMKNHMLYGGGTAEQMLQIATLILDAHLAEVSGHTANAVANFKAAATIQDDLPFNEMPPWYFPARLHLGALLLQHGRAAEAEAIYREDLAHIRLNGWALHGLERSLRAKGDNGEADQVHKQFVMAWQHADVDPEVDH